MPAVLVPQSEDIRGLFSRLDEDPDLWFDIVHLLIDAFLDVGDWEASEACRDVVGEGRMPYYWTGSYGWGRNDVEGRQKSNWPRCTLLPHDMVYRIDTINGDNYTPTILSQLTGFILAWKEGLRP